MTTQSLTEQIRDKASFLCVGLDSDLSKLPPAVRHHPEAQFEFNKVIIEATHDLAVAYKINTAFYESDGSKGYQALEKTIEYLDQNHPNHFTIADAKRGDIGNTSTQYARAFFEKLSFDSVTVAPYMGRDSIEPFLQFEGKYAIMLALTSNQGAYDFQTLNTVDRSLYETVVATSRTWDGADRLG
jgi:orotidine-5'-phosphate decarboxylase